MEGKLNGNYTREIRHRSRGQNELIGKFKMVVDGVISIRRQVKNCNNYITENKYTQKQLVYFLDSSYTFFSPVYELKIFY